MENENLLYLSELLAEEDINTSSLQQEIIRLIDHFKESTIVIKNKVKKLDRHDVKTLGEYYSAELTIQDIEDLLKAIQMTMAESGINENPAITEEDSNYSSLNQRRQIICDLFTKYFEDRSTANNNKFFNISWCHANLGLNSLPLLAEVETVNQVFGAGSIGILTRSNGQALKISTWLRSNMIPHRIQRPLTDRNLNIWIAEIFCSYPSETVNKSEFIEHTCTILNVSEEQAEDYWTALESTVSLTKDRYTIEELLNGVYTNARNPLLFTEENNTSITVSNIHRSKGREFEHVILLDDGIYAEGKEKDIDEHKVSYVSVSRAKHNLLKTSAGKHFIRSFKEGSRRSFETSARRGRKPALSRIEVGKADDLSNEYFAESAEIQKRISKLQVKGQAVELRRNHSITNYIGYDLILEDSEKVVGKTDEFFSRELIEILRTTLGLYGNAMPRFYPDALDEIYLDQKVTVVGRWKR